MEITRLRTLLTGEGGGEAAGSPLTQGKDAYELEVSSAALCSFGGHKGPPSSHPSLYALSLRGWPGASAVLISPSHHVELDGHEAVGTSRNQGCAGSASGQAWARSYKTQEINFLQEPQDE